MQLAVPGRQRARLSGAGRGRRTDPVGPCDGHRESAGELRRLLSVLGPLSGHRSEVVPSFFEEKGRRRQKPSYNNYRSTRVPTMTMIARRLHTSEAKLEHTYAETKVERKRFLFVSKCVKMRIKTETPHFYSSYLM